MDQQKRPGVKLPGFQPVVLATCGLVACDKKRQYCADGGTGLDVRPTEEYKAGHIPGAINVPLEELEQHLHELNPEREIVAYCRGPHCGLMQY